MIPCSAVCIKFFVTGLCLSTVTSAACFYRPLSSSVLAGPTSSAPSASPVRPTVFNSAVPFYTAVPLYTSIRSPPFVRRLYPPVSAICTVQLVRQLHRHRLPRPLLCFCHVRVRKRILNLGIFYCRCYRAWVCLVKLLLSCLHYGDTE